jgi:CDGSH-type Zn-finger protein
MHLKLILHLHCCAQVYIKSFVTVFMSSNKQNIGKEKMLCKVSLNGPYIVKGNVPLIKMVIEADEEGYPYTWTETETYQENSTYRLCRCGKSQNKPYCDNHHKTIKFDGTETAINIDFNEKVKTYDGPELKLLDNKELCVGSGFCTRAGNIWNLTTHSDIPEYKEIAIQEAFDCPSGRLVLEDKAGKILEPILEPSIAVTEDEDGIPGPLWVRGGIRIQSEEKGDYQIRNRVTLCCCGKSHNKPLCDGGHLDEDNET